MISTLPTPIIIAEFSKNSRECVRVSIDEYKGQTLIAIRVFYRVADGWHPSKSGISIAIRHIQNLASALADGVTKARELGLITPEHGTGG